MTSRRPLESPAAHEEKPALLALEDGRVFSGVSFGAAGTATGEVCFNTSMTGYQEILTDPSYRGQIVAMTYPEIGNYGINATDGESSAPHLRGFVVAEVSPVASNWRAQETLPAYLARHGIPGIKGIDTRALTKHLRDVGAMRGCISTEILDPGQAVQEARNSAPMEGSDFVREVTPRSAVPWDDGASLSRRWALKKAGGDCRAQAGVGGEHFLPLPPVEHRVAALDFGAKRNILRLLRQQGCEVVCLPATATPAEILALDPDGVLLSNGPGDPAALGYAHRTVRELVGKLPIFGICLGHQIIALALGGRTFKLKFGHRGANHPVQDLETKAVCITSQNHGFAVERDSLPEDVLVTHINLNDRTVAGLRHKHLPVFSVQYHPEASPGPHDAEYFFRDFLAAIRARKAASPAANN